MDENLNYQRIEKAIEYISNNFKTQPELDEVARAVNLSPYHFQKIFTEWAGVSPKKFLQYLTVTYLKSRINYSPNIIEVAEETGLSSQSRVYDLFVNLEAVTPGEYKNSGKGLKIYYSFHNTPFGEVFIAVSKRGICSLSFCTENSDDIELFRRKWSFAELEENNSETQKYIEQIFYNKNRSEKINLLVQGTNFQIKVWEALLKIPESSLTTYQNIANQISNPKAVRAVGGAVGANPLAFIIPCHRVIRKEGHFGEYRWGSNRKKAIIAWEMAKN